MLIPFISLNALPFASNLFDFVRIRYIGLAVPEDKVKSFVPHNRSRSPRLTPFLQWQDLLEVGALMRYYVFVSFTPPAA